VHCLLAGGAIELFMTRVAAAKESGAARQQRSRKIHTRGRPPLKFISGRARAKIRPIHWQRPFLSYNPFTRR
jgi:hypothetical protein